MSGLQDLSPDARGCGRPARWAWGLALAALAVSGFGQMPIFKRYYIADVPGLAWTADFHATHVMHYVAATVLLLVAFCALGRYLGARFASRASWRLTPLGLARVLALAGLAATGAVRVVKNLPGHHFGRELTMFVDWTHLALALAFLGLILAARLMRTPYARKA